MPKRFFVIAAFFLLIPLLSSFWPAGFPGGGIGLVILNAQESAAPPEPSPGWWQRFLTMFSREKLIPGFRDSLPVGLGTGEGMIDKYRGLYQTIHSRELETYDSLRRSRVVNWDNYHWPDVGQGPYRSREGHDQNYHVFGWHPYWMGNAYESYDFKLLSHLAWFSYDLDPLDGGYTNPEVIDLWKSTDLVDLAHEDSCKVLLTVTSHQVEGNRQFLNNPSAQQALAANLLALLEEKGADGIDLNFEAVPKGYGKKMTYFIRDLSRALKAKDKHYLLSVILPKLDPYGIYEVDSLQRHVDLFIVTGYDFYTGVSRSDGPVAPLRMWEGAYSIENTVFPYLEKGLDRKKILLGLPYYGTAWASEDDLPFQRGNIFDRHITYREIRSGLVEDRLVRYDSLSWSAFAVIPSEGHDATGSWQASQYPYLKIWFDDTVTLQKKYEWVLDQDLGGIGIWALGYDNRHPEMWRLIDRSFSPTGVAYFESRPQRFPVLMFLQRYKNLVLVTGVFLLLFLGLGLVSALFNDKVREVFFEQRSLRILYIGGMAVMGVGLYLFLLFVNRDFGTAFLGYGAGPLMAGLVIGAGATLLVNHLWETRRSRLP